MTGNQRFILLLAAMTLIGIALMRVAPAQQPPPSPASNVQEAVYAKKFVLVDEQGKPCAAIQRVNGDWQGPHRTEFVILDERGKKLVALDDNAGLGGQLLLYRDNSLQSSYGPSREKAAEYDKLNVQAPPLVILSAGLTPAQGHYLVTPYNDTGQGYSNCGLVFLNGTDNGGQRFPDKNGNPVSRENSEMAVYGSSGLAVYGDNTKARAQLWMDKTGKPLLSLTDKDGKKTRDFKP